MNFNDDSRQAPRITYVWPIDALTSVWISLYWSTDAAIAQLELGQPSNVLLLPQQADKQYKGNTPTMSAPLSFQYCIPTDTTTTVRICIAHTVEVNIVSSDVVAPCYEIMALLTLYLFNYLGISSIFQIASINNCKRSPPHPKVELVLGAQQLYLIYHYSLF